MVNSRQHVSCAAKSIYCGSSGIKHYSVRVSVTIVETCVHIQHLDASELNPVGAGL